MAPFASSHAWKCTSVGLLLLLHIVEIFLGVLHTWIKILLENLHARPHYQWCRTPGEIWIRGCESKALHQGDDRVPWLSAAIWKPLFRISQFLQPSDECCSVLFFTQTGLNWTPRRVTGCYWRVLKMYTVLNGGVISLTTWYQKRRWEKKNISRVVDETMGDKVYSNVSIEQKQSKMNCIISHSLVLSLIEAFQSTTRKIIGCFHNGRSLTNAQNHSSNIIAVVGESFSVCYWCLASFVLLLSFQIQSPCNGGLNISICYL